MANRVPRGWRDRYTGTRNFARVSDKNVLESLR